MNAVGQDTRAGFWLRAISALRTICHAVTATSFLVSSGVFGQESLNAPPTIPQRIAPAETPARPGYLGLILHTRAGLAFVKRLVPGWPAEQAGLRTGDMLMSVDGIPAQSPELKRALDRLSGEAGNSVELRVLRQGEAAPLTLRVMRSPNAPPQAAGPGQPRGEKSPAEAQQEAIAALARGEEGPLRVYLERTARERPAALPAAVLNIVRYLAHAEGDFAAEIALTHARACAAAAPASPLCIEAVRLAYELQSEKTDLATFAKQTRTKLSTDSKNYDPLELSSAILLWNGLELLGKHRTGRAPFALQKLKRLLGRSDANIQVITQDGKVLWQAPIRPNALWPSYAAELSKTNPPVLQEGQLREILSLDEPTWIWPLLLQYEKETLIELRAHYLEPRWPLRVKSAVSTVFQDSAGGMVQLSKAQRERPALLLHCPAGENSCEGIRMSLASMLAEHSELDILNVMIFYSKPTPTDASLSWPVWYRTELPPKTPFLQVVSPSGDILQSYADWSAGLEYRVLWQLRAIMSEEGAPVQGIVQSGTNLNSWELRWMRETSTKLSAQWSRPAQAAVRLWIASPRGGMDIMEDGQTRTGIEALENPDMFWLGELDGDSKEELVLYHSKDRMLESIDSSGAPRWIRIEDSPVSSALTYDLTGDRLDEIILYRQNDTRLTCLGHDGTIAWSSPFDTQIVDVAAGQSLDGGAVLGVLVPGRVILLDKGGQHIRELRTAMDVTRIHFADLNGDGETELVLAPSDTHDIQKLDLNGDKVMEVALSTHPGQLLVYSSAGQLLSRLGWLESYPDLQSADMDGDGREELTVRSTKLTAVLEWQQEKGP